jgi:hypothetical protein
MVKYANETAKMYKIFDNAGLLAELSASIPNKSIPATDLLETQAKFLGYLDYINPKAKGYGYVLNVDTKYSPKINLYCLDTGDTITDDDGTKIIVSAGSYTGTDPESVYVMVTQGNGMAGQTNGLKVKVQVGVGGTPEELTFVGSTATETQLTTSPAGLSITVTVDSTNLVTPNPAPTTTPFMNWGRFAYTPAVTTLTEGVDYIIDDQRLRGGVITIPATSTLKEGDTVYISANVPEASYPTVSGANAGDIAGELLFLGDPNIGGNYVIEAWKVKVTPDGDFTGLISDDFGSFSLTVKFLADYEHHPKYPFYKATMIGKGSGTSANGSKYDPRY